MIFRLIFCWDYWLQPLHQNLYRLTSKSRTSFNNTFFHTVCCIRTFMEGISRNLLYGLLLFATRTYLLTKAPATFLQSISQSTFCSVLKRLLHCPLLCVSSKTNTRILSKKHICKNRVEKHNWLLSKQFSQFALRWYRSLNFSLQNKVIDNLRDKGFCFAELWWQV